MGQFAVDDPDVGDHAAVGVVDRVEDQRAGRGLGIADRCRDLPDDLVEQLAYAGPPVFADTRSTSDGSQPMIPASSAAYFSGCALGRSILFSTGMMVRSASMARYRLARVCASIPCAASTSRIAPSQASRERETS